MKFLTIDEIEEVFKDHFDKTGEWDPRINGADEKLLAPLQPNDPSLSKEQRNAVIAARAQILDHSDWEHEIFVGQRMANQYLLSMLREKARE